MREGSGGRKVHMELRRKGENGHNKQNRTNEGETE